MSFVLFVGDVITASFFGLACGIGENSDEAWRGFCESGLPLAPWLGALAVTAGSIVAHWRRSHKPWTVGASLGVASGLALWVLMGDPAGNFPGVLTG